MACWNTSIKKVGSVLLVQSGDRTKSYKGKFWVARIKKYSPELKYKFEREFINDFSAAHITQPGIYEVYRGTPYGDERYFIVVDDELNYEVVYDRTKIIERLSLNDMT